MNAHHAIDLITALWLGGLGACIGSFLNVVAYRMPLGMSIIWKPSHCPKCSHAIRARDNVPVFGWLWLRGRCRDCGEPISPRYAVVEFLMGLAFFALAYFELFSGGQNLPDGPLSQYAGAMDNVWIPYWPLIGIYAYHCLLLSLLGCVTLVDLDQQKAPNKLVGFGLVAGIGLAVWFPHLHPAASLIIEDTPIIFSGVAGALIGWGLGMASARLLALLRQQPLDGSNLSVGFAFLGAFLGWQGLFSMLAATVVASVATLAKKESSHCCATLLLGPVALVQLATWKLLTEALGEL